MPPDSSPGLLDGHGGAVRASAAERAARVRFRRAIALMVMTLLVPGSAQLTAGNRKVGRIAVFSWLGLIALGLVTLLVVAVHREFAYWMVSDTGLLLFLRLLLTAAAIGWALLFVDAWRIGQPLTLGLAHRRATVGVNGFLALAVAGVLLFGAHLVAVQRDFMLTTFGDGAASGANAGRFNVLLLGGDSGSDRWGLRPDAMILASIDAETGRTVLVSLPRNLQRFPFRKGSVMAEQFPDGFDCDGCYLNGVSTWAQDNVELFPDSENPGVDATVMAVEGITDLDVNYWAMVNLRGFEKLVDAVGGVTLNVRSPIPVGGLGDDVTGYIQPGERKLDGHDTLWYARAREGSDDYSRMARQKCVMTAMLTQVSPQSAVKNFGAIAEASAAMVSTDVPGSEVDMFLDLALKAKDQKVSSVSLVPPAINTAEPDIAKVRAMVRDAIAAAEGKKPAAAAGGAAKKKAPGATRPTPGSVTGGSLGSRNEGYAANQAEDVAAAC
ncbi:LCP family protein [Nocardioides pantholopis]|uniref:LCP family protein n=1 Tax=Nocardioides pantholopis TaxID=2483798 RepID=UPI000FD74620|nr:LCP family protein [Nocardioides pantholopis]